MLLGLTLLSGMAGLVHELLYLRILSSTVGELFQVHTILVAVFLLALGVGALVAHRLVRWLFAVELALGLHAFLFPGIVGAFAGSWLDGLIDAPGPHAVLASTLLLAWPAACVGVSVPCFSAYLAPRLGREAFARTYVVFNLGAALGLLGVEFALVRWVGFAKSLAAAGAVNLVVGLALWFGRKRLPPPSPEPPVGFVGRSRAGAVFLASAFGGLFTAAFLKLSYALFSPRRENFALCTAALLLALAFGTLIVEKLRWSFSRCLLLAACALGCVWSAIPFVATSYRTAAQAVALYGGGWLGRGLAGAGGVATMRLAVALLIGGSVYALLGAALPALLRGEEAAARASGQLLFVSGVGNVLGLLLFVSLLHPSLPFFATAALTAVGFCFAAIALRESLGAVELSALAATALLVPCLLSVPETIVYTSFLNYPEARIEVFKSGSDDTTLVRTGGSARIHYNGMPEIRVSDRSGSVNAAEITVGLAPALLAPRRERALVLGLGSGITAGTVARLFERTDVVDLNRAALGLAGALGYANFEVLENPGFVFHNQDARRYLARAVRTPYDLVVNTVSTPKFSAAAKVYTVEFFDAVKRSLAPDGLYATWFSPSDTSSEGVRILLAGLASRFRFCALVTVRGAYYTAACSDEPLERKWSMSEIPADVAQLLERSLGVPVGVEAYLNAALLTRDAFKNRPLAASPLNHDDYPLLEFYLRELPGTALPDPIDRDPEAFNIRPDGDPSAPGFLEHAMVLYRLHTGLFRRFFETPLLNDRKLRETFARRLDIKTMTTPDVSQHSQVEP